jgi:hypothetical protein
MLSSKSQTRLQEFEKDTIGGIMQFLGMCEECGQISYFSLHQNVMVVGQCQHCFDAVRVYPEEEWNAGANQRNNPNLQEGLPSGHQEAL